jgi:hypothetical protein
VYSGKYGGQLLEIGQWFLDGDIALTEFLTLFLAFCGPAELLALLAGVGLTILAVYIYIKCEQGP